MPNRNDGSPSSANDLRDKILGLDTRNDKPREDNISATKQIDEPKSDHDDEHDETTDDNQRFSGLRKVVDFHWFVLGILLPLGAIVGVGSWALAAFGVFDFFWMLWVPTLIILVATLFFVSWRENSSLPILKFVHLVVALIFFLIGIVIWVLIPHYDADTDQLRTGVYALWHVGFEAGPVEEQNGLITVIKFILVWIGAPVFYVHGIGCYRRLMSEPTAIKTALLCYGLFFISSVLFGVHAGFSYDVKYPFAM